MPFHSIKVETITTGETYGADVALMDQVKRKVNLVGTIQDGQYVIVFCPITSRVGSDVGAAMQNMSRSHKMPFHSIKVETITKGETYGADVALMDQVKRKVNLEGTTQDGQYVIVFCPITSRVGSDVGAAMQNMSTNKKIILVLMHHTRDANYSTAGRSWSEDYPNIQLELHVLFHETQPGLLTCSKNTEAVFQMQEFFKHNRINSHTPLLRHSEPVLATVCTFWPLLLLLIGVIVVFLVLMIYFLKVQKRSINGTN
ncbi:uncharacterized protein LOC119790192 [Cyprinodon tularosa]|uniref:uncharacterized protein LOC119790192 n=1 Tax=Cyprinodon tularosa TaxID=77115 RepID=UPI0018E21078|nr:uncharacterized protein LOC119790192 [Cyprinodon tularosa]